jgi:hypothetical protein
VVPHPITELKRTNLELPEQLHKALNPKDDVRDRFDPKDTAEDIAAVIIGMYRETKARSIANAILAGLRPKQKPAG